MVGIHCKHRRKAGARANGVVVGAFDVGWVNVPVVLEFVTDHDQYPCQNVIDRFNDSFCARIRGASCEFLYAEQCVRGGCHLGAKIIREEEDMCIPRAIVGEALSKSTLTEILGLLGKRIGRTGHQPV